MFWYLLIGLLAGFGIMFWMAKSGRLTAYMLIIDGALIQAKPLFETVIDFDFTHILTAVQQGWLVFTATVLAGIARFRGQIKERLGMKASR